MSNSNKHEKRIGGYAGEGMPLADVIKVAIKNTTRAHHDIGGAAPAYGDQMPIHLHQGEIAQADLDNGLRGHPHDLDQHKDER